jgi:ArsR family transcriptional regulator
MKKTLSIIKALSDGNRLRVMMSLNGNEELCVCQLIELLGLAPATVSRHMSILQNAMLVESRKDGRWVYYRISKHTPPRLLEWLSVSMKDSAELASDRKVVKRIVSYELDDLCKTRRLGRQNKTEETSSNEPFAD